jgi:hypothetical protein
MQGAYRYEQLGDNRAYDAIGSAIARLRAYTVSGNRALLIDVANLVELEWCSPRLEGTYYRDTDRGDEGDPGGVPQVSR